MPSQLLNSMFQLDQLNKQVWADMARTSDEAELVKSNIENISPPALTAVNEPDSNVTEAIPPLDEFTQL